MCEWTGGHGAQGVNTELRPQLLQSEPHPTSASTEYQKERFDFASVTFGNLHGCTININTAPSQASTSSQSLLDLSEIDIDKLFAELPEPQ